ncbi:hypothetical protein BD779DRAFT_1477089 [Infundibulicybe gibba]|nr:hypothetical protein BD779DRAFT_1477089 [Infundibulicybe gibba]
MVSERNERGRWFCFDGTGKKFGKDRVGLIALGTFEMLSTLEKNDGNEQLVYYRPGVGTSPKSQRWATPASRIFTKVEEAFATGLPDHTTREQLDFAYSVYGETDKAASKLGSGFKRNFSCFRHALALDERRTKFRPSVWGEPDSVREELDAKPFVEGRGETARTIGYIGRLIYACEEDATQMWGQLTVESLQHISSVDDQRMLSRRDPQYGEDPLLTLIGDGDDAIARVGDHAAPIGDRLRVLSYWWLLELIPTSITLQSDEGWTRLRQSVRDRMDHYEEYKPIAYNWDDIINMNVVKWEE